MPKIPQSTIDRIRDQSDIVDIISEEVSLKRKGVNYFGRCPFHDEKTPSFSVSPAKQIYHCFGCGNGGNVFTFLMEFQKFTFYEAVKSLANKYNIVIETTQEYHNNSEYSLLYQVHEKATMLYQKNLFSQRGEKALKYLKERNLQEDTINRFRIGFAIKSWNDLLNSLNHIGSHDSLMKSGLFIRSEKGTFDRFRSRIMFPIFHQSGKVNAFGGRDFGDNDSAKYLNSPETALYQKSNTLYGLHVTKGVIRKLGYAILVEGYMDFLQLYQAGIEPVVSVSGTSLTKNHAIMLSKLVNKVILLYDGDVAGGNAAIRAGFIIFQIGMEAQVVRPPNDLDPDDWIIQNRFDDIKSAIENPITFLDFHMEFYNATELKGIRLRDYLHELLLNINQISDVIIKNEFIKNIAEKFHIKEIELIQILNSKKAYNKIQIEDKNENNIKFTSKIHRAELELTKIIMHADVQNRKNLKKLISLDLITHEFLSRIINWLYSNQQFESSKLIEKFPDKTERELISKLLIDEKIKDTTEEIVNDCIRTLKSASIKNKITKLRDMIKKKESAGENSNKELKDIMILQSQLNELEK